MFLGVRGGGRQRRAVRRRRNKYVAERRALPAISWESFRTLAAAEIDDACDLRAAECERYRNNASLRAAGDPRSFATEHYVVLARLRAQLPFVCTDIVLAYAHARGWPITVDRPVYLCESIFPVDVTVLEGALVWTRGHRFYVRQHLSMEDGHAFQSGEPPNSVASRCDCRHCVRSVPRAQCQGPNIFSNIDGITDSIEPNHGATSLDSLSSRATPAAPVAITGAASSGRLIAI